MDESSSRFRIPKTLDEEKARVINSIPKSAVHKSKWALPAVFFDNSKAKDRTRFAPLSQTEWSKIKILVWMCKS